ncbi:MAG: ATP-binding cassette domain-containing protein [Deltaproteobacteria bacterium]|nr:ATP-binding cassette domain-containing protein [Candidatus Anaeroferrophillus wilburensis]MBN2890186.1 ATP-binding cassette domain-containing protein [Deltaproteobacteria bacterium]
MLLLTIEKLSKVYGSGCPDCLVLTGNHHDRAICPRCQSVVAINQVNLQVETGMVLGVVGESGSGKSTLLQLIYRDLQATSGSVSFQLPADDKEQHVNLMELSYNELSRIRNTRMSMIYQNARLGLNFLFSAGGNIAEKIIASGERKYGVIRQQVLQYTKKIEIPTERIDDYPESFSGGQQQRIQIAKALSSSPQLLLLDEPTTGLDVSVQAKILDLIKALRLEMGFTMIVVSHDLGVIKHLTDLTVVMKNGSIVEQGLTDQILEDPQHAYTQLLVSSIL